MKSVGSYEAKTHLPRLLGEVEKGATITITKRGKPIAVLAPAQATAAQRDIAAVIAEFRAYSREQARKRGPLSAHEIKGGYPVSEHDFAGDGFSACRRPRCRR